MIVKEGRGLRIGKIVTRLAAIAVLVAPLSAAAQATTTPERNTNVGIPAQVSAYFPNDPIMVAIARCESRFRQFNSAGTPLDGGSGGMIGIFQISSGVHTARAKSMGMNIYTIDGNLAYAKYLYQQEGTVPWVSSSACWNTSPISTATSTLTIVASTSSPDSTGDEAHQIAALQVQITSLQQILATLLKQRSS